MKLEPDFNSVLSDPEIYIDHIGKLTNRDEPSHYIEILNDLISQFEPLDFEALAYPQIEKLRVKLNKIESLLTKPDGIINLDTALDQERDQYKKLNKQLERFKLNTKQLLVLSIENVHKVAEANRWGLCKNHDFIYLFNGKFWINIDKEAFQKFLGEAAEKMGVGKFSARHYQFREQLFKQFVATSYFPAPESNNDLVLINLKNGTFEIGANETKLRPFEKDDFITYQLPFNYNSEAKATIFQNYLDKVLPDKESQKILSEYLGYVFMKHGNTNFKEEKTLLLYGTGANGKSVFFEVVNALLGKENVSSFSLQSLTNDNGYFRAKLGNKLVNYASEINGKLETSIFKQLVSGEPVEARLPYGEPFTLNNYAKLIFNCNELPKDVEHTHAYFRRFLIIPFNVTIPESEQDKQLHNKIIQNELSGVFNWILEGLKRLLAQKSFSDCEAVQLARAQYEKQSDSVKLFIEENNYEKSAHDYILIKELFKEYKEFCLEDGYKPVGKSNFIKRLNGFQILTDRKNTGNVAYLIKASIPF